MARLAYYAKERARHPDLRARLLTFREARRLTKMLCKEHGVPLAKVLRAPRRRSSSRSTTRSG